MNDGDFSSFLWPISSLLCLLPSTFLDFCIRFSWKILAPITLESILQWNRTELILLKASLPPPSFAPFSQNEDDAINKIRFLSALTSCKIHL